MDNDCNDSKLDDKRINHCINGFMPRPSQCVASVDAFQSDNLIESNRVICIILV